MQRQHQLQKEPSPQFFRKSSEAISISKRTLFDMAIEFVTKMVIKEWLANKEYNQFVEDEIKRITERRAALTLKIEQATFAKNRANETLNAAAGKLNVLRQQIQQCEQATYSIMQNANDHVIDNNVVLKQTGIRFFALCEQVNLNHQEQSEALDIKLNNICEIANAKKELESLKENFDCIKKMKLELNFDDISTFNIEEHPDPNVAIAMKGLFNEIKALTENVEPSDYHRLTIPINLSDIQNIWFLLNDYETIYASMYSLVNKFHAHLTSYLAIPSEWRLQASNIQSLVNEMSKNIIAQWRKSIEGTTNRNRPGW